MIGKKSIQVNLELIKRDIKLKFDYITTEEFNKFKLQRKLHKIMKNKCTTLKHMLLNFLKKICYLVK